MNEIAFQVTGESDIAEAARCARRFARFIGLGAVQAHYVATAASELAANLLVHAGGGRFEVRVLPGRPGLELQAIDYGPGIANLEQAMQEGFSTAGSLGCGLPGVKRLMDEMEIDTRLGQGTSVRARKWG
jgi:serine/threonine-protein kinase RsbT